MPGDSTRPTLLQRVVDECIGRLSRASASPVTRQLTMRAESLRAALRDRGNTTSTKEQETAVGELVLELAEQVLGRIDSSVESVRRWIKGERAERTTDPAPAAGAQLKLCPKCKTLQRGANRHCKKCSEDLLGVHAAVIVDQRYALTEELGRGTMGVVYLAYDLNLERRVALKLLVDDASDTGAAGRFRREATALASIRNEHVVQVYAFGTHDGGHFLAMEYVDGSTLDDILREYARSHERVPVARAVTVLAQAARGLSAVHAAGIVHRDIKPANLVVEQRTGRPVIIDFGVALRNAEATTLDARAGTPHYMSPEQILADTAEDVTLLTARTDVYALGCVAYELLCGRTPFEAPSVGALLRMHLESPAAPVSTLRPGLEAFDAVLQRALAKAPDERYATCSDFAHALEGAYRSFASPPPTLRPPPPAPTPNEGPPIAAASGTPEVGLRVLVVDDDPMIQQICERCAVAAFGPDNVDVMVVSSGTDALARAEETMPDILLLDYSMPGLDGLETLSRLRAMPRATRARVVVISAAGSELPQWKFSVLGVSDFVAKPLRIAPFIELLKDIASDAGWGLSKAG